MDIIKTASYQVFAADLGYFESTARKYKLGALKIKDNNFSSCTPAFHLLSTIAFELFPKVLIGYNICLKYKGNEIIDADKIRLEIYKEIKKYSHKLDKLYKDFPDLIKYLDIKNISEFKNGYVWEYRIIFNNKKEIQLKDIEAVRYESFAQHRDIMTLCTEDELIIEILNKLEKYVEIKHLETNIEFKK
jgi:hypothetical protein